MGAYSSWTVEEWRLLRWKNSFTALAILWWYSTKSIDKKVNVSVADPNLFYSDLYEHFANLDLDPTWAMSMERIFFTLIRIWKNGVATLYNLYYILDVLKGHGRSSASCSEKQWRHLKVVVYIEESWYTSIIFFKGNSEIFSKPWKT